MALLPSHSLRSAARLMALLALTQPAAAKEIAVSNRAELNAALKSAQPGDQILLAPGAYEGGASAVNLHGTAEASIVIAGADPSDPPVIRGGASGLQLSSPRHVEIRNLLIQGASGNGLNIDDGGAVETPARHVVIRDVTIRDVGPAGNSDGIKLSGVENFRITGCLIEQWGSGGSAIDMVGCHHGLIERCRLRGRGGEQASGIQTKGGTSEITIRRCRIEDAGARGVNVGGSTGLPYFRPRNAPYEARDITVEDCELIGGQAAIAFVGVDGATVRHNTIYRPRTWAFRILQESVGDRFVPSRRGLLTKNLILFRSDEIRSLFNVGGHTEPDSFHLADNAWACSDDPVATKRLVNSPVPEDRGSYGPPPPLSDEKSLDLRQPEREAESPGVRHELSGY